jgi:TonB family protein
MAKSNRIRRVFLFMAAIWAAWIVFPSTSAQAQVFLNRSEVIAPSDYPIDALRRGDEGITAFLLRIGRDGRAKKCEILESSGHAPLDDAVCRLMLEKAKFDVSAVGPNTDIPPMTDRVRWAAPVTFARPLYKGVTVNQSPSAIDPNKIRCNYSDGKVRYVSVGTSCNRDALTKEVIKDGKVYRLGIIDRYIEDFIRTKSADSAFNAALLLMENEYSDGIYYMEQASARGSSAASSVLCGLYANELSAEFGKFNPNQALEYCILSYKQSYLPGVVDISNQIYSTYSSRLNKEIYERAKLTIKPRSQTSYAQLITPGNEVVRPKDYPYTENIKQIGGRTSVLMLISAQGWIESCIITESTYSYVLDQKVCSRMRDAATFAPAIIDGQTSAQWLSKSVNWKPWTGSRDPNRSILMNIILGILGAAL